jgi:hypothetical protein
MISGLAKTVDGEVFFGVDSTDAVERGEGRKSVRLESKEQFDEGLFIVDFEHLPGNACGMWPAL